MKFFLYASLFVAYALEPKLDTKLCINCKFFKKDFWTSPTFAKCSLFPKAVYDNSFCVTGIPETKKIEYPYCSIVRTYECGQEGKFYQPKLS